MSYKASELNFSYKILEKKYIKQMMRNILSKNSDSICGRVCLI